MADLHHIAAQLVESGRGILAADESIKTMSSRLESEGIGASKETRRDYRELLLTAPGLAETITGIILSDETFNDSLADGEPFPQACRDRGLLPGIKVDTGTTPLPNGGGATITEGLDGLGGRLADYAAKGAAFAKWRAVIDLGNTSEYAQEVNAHALARYAALCQDNGIVPVVEPEVMCDGPHDLAACEQATQAILVTVFDQLDRQQVDPSGMVLKPNMVTPGLEAEQVPAETVASATLRVLSLTVPTDVPGIAFLSGGHSNEAACDYLGAINEHAGPAPWSLSYSFGRALVSAALHTWQGDSGKIEAAQTALLANCRRASDAAGRRPTYAHATS